MSMKKIPFDFEKYQAGATAVARSDNIEVINVMKIPNTDRIVAVYKQHIGKSRWFAVVRELNGLSTALGLKDTDITDLFLEVPETWGIKYETDHGLKFTVAGFKTEAEALSRAKVLYGIKPDSIKTFKCED